jgi:O-antigen ligase
VIAVTLAALAWGALAFGAVYPWGYWPLFAALTVAGALGVDRRRVRAFVPLAGAITAVAVAAGVQLVPLPRAALVAMSPATDTFLRGYDIGYSAGLTNAHALSIEPAFTGLALAALVSLGVFTVGLAGALSRRGTVHLVNGIVALGSVLAVAAIVQKASGTDRIYGFWRPYDHSFQIFGPFVNKNHFAGWMVMALSMSIGSLWAKLSDVMRGMRADWQSRVRWLSTPDASLLVLTAFAIPVMSLALVMTFSRSGILCFGVTLVLAAWFIVRRQGHGLAGGLLGVSSLAALVMAAVAWAGVDPIVTRFTAGQGVGGRLEAWRAAVTIARHFPVAGTGLDTYNTVMLFYGRPGGARWNAAHNDYLQLASEGGLLVGVPVAAAVLLLAREIARRFREAADDTTTYWLRVGALAGLGGMALQETVDFSLQIPGIAALFAALCAIAIHVPQRRSDAPQTIVRRVARSKTGGVTVT